MIMIFLPLGYSEQYNLQEVLTLMSDEAGWAGWLAGADEDLAQNDITIVIALPSFSSSLSSSSIIQTKTKTK